MTKRRNWSVLDTIGWIAFAIVIVYLLLRALGVINSPLSVDLMAIISGAFFVGKYAMKMDYFFKDVEDIKEDIRKLDGNCPIFEEKRTKTKQFYFKNFVYNNMELNEEIKKEMAEARTEIKKGKFHSLEKVKEDLGF